VVSGQEPETLHRTNARCAGQPAMATWVFGCVWRNYLLWWNSTTRRPRLSMGAHLPHRSWAISVPQAPVSAAGRTVRVHWYHAVLPNMSSGPTPHRALCAHRAWHSLASRDPLKNTGLGISSQACFVVEGSRRAVVGVCCTLTLPLCGARNGDRSVLNGDAVTP
jgi:hypothetical protein